MPTGYTAVVKDGTITEFSEFVMRCARAFGACIEMRDDPSDATIPEKFEPAPYYTKHVEEARAELVLICSMSEADKEVAFVDAQREDVEYFGNLKKERAEHLARYEAMLEKVEAWTPPTDDHQELRKFMRSQLRESIDFDCRWSLPKPRRFTTADALWRERLADALHSLETAEKSLADEIERQAKHTKWIADLRRSLTTESV